MSNTSTHSSDSATGNSLSDS